MANKLTLVLCACFLLMTSLTVAAQATLSGESTDSCSSLTLTQNMNREETIKISRALHICDELKKLFDRSQTPAGTLAVEVEQHADEHTFQPGEIDNLLQQPQGQNQLLRQLATQVAQAQQERNALAEELQNRMVIQKVSTKAAALASGLRGKSRSP